MCMEKKKEKNLEVVKKKYAIWVYSVDKNEVSVRLGWYAHGRKEK